jgi:hypothetical protein
MNMNWDNIRSCFSGLARYLEGNLPTPNNFNGIKILWTCCYLSCLRVPPPTPCHRVYKIKHFVYLYSFKDFAICLNHTFFNRPPNSGRSVFRWIQKHAFRQNEPPHVPIRFLLVNTEKQELTHRDYEHSRKVELMPSALYYYRPRPLRHCLYKQDRNFLLSVALSSSRSRENKSIGQNRWRQKLPTHDTCNFFSGTVEKNRCWNTK